MEHPAEIHARAVRRAYRAGYEEAERYAEERIREHVESFGGAKGGGKSHAAQRLAIWYCIKYPGIRVLIIRAHYPELLQNHIE